VGTADANLAPTSFVGHVQLTTIIGRPRCCDTDVKIDVSLNDIRLKSDLSDYTGALQLRLPLRLTDRVNDIDKVQPGTVQDLDFLVTIPCSTTGSATAGSNCAITTEANVLVPGAVSDQRRTIWEVGQVNVYDGGPDGDVGTVAGNTLFATQGVFVP
jgi:hypothetical protein